MLGDGGRHERLRVRRLVLLVVAVPAVAHQVDDDVALERLPVLARQLKHARHRLRVVRVDVQDGHVERLAQVAAVQRGARELGVGGEAHLVVHNHVHRAARLVVLQLRQQEGLHHDALPRKRRVAVHQHRHHLLPRLVARQVLLGARLAHHQGVHRLQVRRVGQQGEVQVGAGGQGAVARRAQVVLHVAAAAPVAVRHARVVLGHVHVRAHELGQQRRHGLGHQVHQHVEAAAVRHADHHRLHAHAAGALRQRLQAGHQHLRALQAKPLGVELLG